jgi:zinc protease
VARGVRPRYDHRVPIGAAASQRQITIVDMPGAAQSQIRIGWVGVPRSTPDYFPLQVLNTILGGSFTSRLNQNLREDARLLLRRQLAVRHAPFGGPFFAGAGVQTDKTAEALPSSSTSSRRSASRSTPTSSRRPELPRRSGSRAHFEAIGDFSAQLEQLLVYGLPDRYYADYVKNLQAVTGDAVLKMPRRTTAAAVSRRRRGRPRR